MKKRIIVDRANKKAKSLPVRRYGKAAKRNRQDNTMNPRTTRLMPLGIPRYVRCYDDGGTSVDRYTVVFCGQYPGRDGCDYVAMSGAPSHPGGFCEWATGRRVLDAPRGWPPTIGRSNHLGRRIPFGALPPDCRRVVLRAYKAIWQLP